MQRAPFMSEREDHSTRLQVWLDGIRPGDQGSQDQVLRHAQERLKRLTRKLLHGYPTVARWQQTDDVLQNSLIRLHRAIAKVQPESVDGFFKLSAKLIRQELIDMGRHILGSLGPGGRHDTG